MKHTTSRGGLLRRAMTVACAGCLLIAAGSVLTGCGDEKQTVTAPDTSGAPPGGGNVTEYKENMKRIQGQGGPGGPGGPGGDPRGGGRGGPPPGFSGGGR